MLFGLPFVTAYICQKDTPITQIITWDKMPAGYIHGFQLEETSTMAKDQHSGKLRFYTTERLTRDLTSCVRKEGISLRFYSGGSREELLFAADEAIAAWGRHAIKAISAQTMHHRRNLRQFEKAAKVRSGAEGSDKPVPPHPYEEEDSDD